MNSLVRLLFLKHQTGYSKKCRYFLTLFFLSNLKQKSPRSGQRGILSSVDPQQCIFDYFESN